jgi:hypothetical protein
MSNLICRIVGHDWTWLIRVDGKDERYCRRCDLRRRNA